MTETTEQIREIPVDSPAFDWTGLTADQVRPEDRDDFDAMKAFDARIARVLEENGGEVICPRCQRPATGWPLRRSRPDSCGDRAAVQCFRDPETVLAGQPAIEVEGV